jgi:hypothetical protein
VGSVDGSGADSFVGFVAVTTPTVTPQWHTPEGYEVDVGKLGMRGALKPHEQVVGARLVVPNGAVPNGALLWVELRFSGREDTRLIALPIAEFHTYVKLPIVGLTGEF